MATFTDGIGLNGTAVCTDGVRATDVALHGLWPRGACVVLGLRERGFKFDAFILVFWEIIVKESLHCSVKEVGKMVDVVTDHCILIRLTILSLEKGEDIQQRAAAHSYTGRLVMKIYLFRYILLET